MRSVGEADLHLQTDTVLIYIKHLFTHQCSAKLKKSNNLEYYI